MILCDYLTANPDLCRDIAKLCGVKNGVIRLPEDDAFDVCNPSHLKKVCESFKNDGITPRVIEPLPNALHEHIKLGDPMRDECIEKCLILMHNMAENGIDTLCFNFMAHYGWTRTETYLTDRGGAGVTGFHASKFVGDGTEISEERMWENYFYFIKAVLPYAEKYGVKLALHPDDPPVRQLGGVCRIFSSVDGIRRAVTEVSSEWLGLTFCQSCYYLMGADLEKTVQEFAKKIFFIHFRNVRGIKTDFRETFHDDGEIDMAKMMKCYYDNGINVPIRVDHVPTLPFEARGVAGYDALARLFAIGYIKGIMDSCEMR